MLPDDFGRDPVGPVEFADFAERTVRDEIHRILAVGDRHVEGELSQRVHRIEGDQPAAAVGLDFPARAQGGCERQFAEYRRPPERDVAERDAATGGSGDQWRTRHRSELESHGLSRQTPSQDASSRTLPSLTGP
jgi:hypothetical protein